MKPATNRVIHAAAVIAVFATGWAVFVVLSACRMGACG